MISYTYKIQNVDADAKTMEVEFTADSHQSVVVSTRLPSTLETLEQVIEQFAPINYWTQQSTEVVIPAVGRTGVITLPTDTSQVALVSVKQQKIDDLVRWRYQVDSIGVEHAGNNYSTGKFATMHVATMVTALTYNLLTTATVLTTAGTFTEFDLAGITTLASKILQKAQTLSAQEQALLNQIKAASTTTELQTIAIPTN